MKQGLGLVEVNPSSLFGILVSDVHGECISSPCHVVAVCPSCWLVTVSLGSPCCIGTILSKKIVHLGKNLNE